jgi:hypothetical protein
MTLASLIRSRTVQNFDRNKKTDGFVNFNREINFVFEFQSLP